jgi:hypothetical protein
LDEEQAIAISKVNTTTHLALQHNQLMSERGILRLKSAPSRRNGALSDGGSFTPNKAAADRTGYSRICKRAHDLTDQTWRLADATQHPVPDDLCSPERQVAG